MGGSRDLKTVAKNDFVSKNADFRVTPQRFNQEEATGARNDNLVPSVDVGPNVPAVRGCDDLVDHFKRSQSTYSKNLPGKMTY